MSHNSEREMLHKNLMEILQNNYMFYYYWAGPTTLAFISFLVIISALLQSPPSQDIILSFAPLLLFSIVYQAVILTWLYKLRQILKTATPTQARYCFVGNIIFALFLFILPPICGILIKNLLCFFVSLIMASILLVPIARINRFIKFLHFQTNPSRQKQEASSPCPEIFRRMDMFRSLWALPLFLAALPLLFFLIVKFCFKDQVPLEMIVYVTGGSGLVGLFVAVLTGGNYWFIKQTAAPSAFQKFIRNLTFPNSRYMESYLERYVPYYEIKAYKWWLSHPGEPWPENMAELCKHIDTTQFDWQDPAAWEIPLAQAAKKLQQTLVPEDMPVLSIGSKAQDMAQELSTKPVTQITPLFQAILDQDISALEKKLPNSDLNRPFAATGNTPLHVAALNGYTDIVRLLLEQPGIDTTRTNNEGKTALDLAHLKGHLEIIQLLERHH